MLSGTPLLYKVLLQSFLDSLNFETGRAAAFKLLYNVCAKENTSYLNAKLKLSRFIAKVPM